MRVYFLKTVGLLFNRLVAFEANQGVTLKKHLEYTYSANKQIKKNKTFFLSEKSGHQHGNEHKNLGIPNRSVYVKG